MPKVKVRIFKDGVGRLVEVGMATPTILVPFLVDRGCLDDLRYLPSLEEATRSRPVEGWKEIYGRTEKGYDGVWQYEFHRREPL
jgi:hypothetical protein